MESRTNSEVELGGTGNLPVLPGYQPGGREGALIGFLIAQKSRAFFSVPRGTGRLPVLPGGCATAISEFEFNTKGGLALLATSQNVVWRWMSRLVRLALSLSFAWVFSGVLGANLAQGASTILGVEGAHFTLNNRPVFLLGFSYYGALGAPEDFIRKDLLELRARGFNWLRVWATWSAYETNVSAVTAAGLPREPYLARLKWLVAECDRLGMAVDVTLTRGNALKGLEAHEAAVDTLVSALKGFRNWYLDLGNERDVKDARHVSLAELKELRGKVRTLDPQRLVTASFGGHDLSLTDVREAVELAGVDFLCTHRPRNRKTPGETEAETLRIMRFTKEVGRIVPVHYQEPFRRGYTSWEPVAADFLTDLRGALKGGAAGWCFHNGGQRTKPDEQPRRSFDLRAKRLMDQLDDEEIKVVMDVKSVLLDHEKRHAGVSAEREGLRADVTDIHAGRNRIEARAVIQFGVAGPVSTALLELGK